MFNLECFSLATYNLIGSLMFLTTINWWQIRKIRHRIVFAFDAELSVWWQISCCCEVIKQNRWKHYEHFVRNCSSCIWWIWEIIHCAVMKKLSNKITITQLCVPLLFNVRALITLVFTRKINSLNLRANCANFMIIRTSDEFDEQIWLNF